MGWVDVARSMVEAARLLSLYPAVWFGLVLVFLGLVESLMFVPYVGFVLKVCAAALLGAQSLALFASAAAGQPPRLGMLLDVLSLPLAPQALLCASALLPFAAGLVYLRARGGRTAVGYFFGNIVRDAPPEPALFKRFKVVMHLVSMPFVFLAGAIVLKSIETPAALSVALDAALQHWPAVVALFATGLAFENVIDRVTRVRPKAAAVALAATLLIGFVGWSFAFIYAVSAQAFRT